MNAMSSCQHYQIPLHVGCGVFYSCVFPPSLGNRLHWSNVSAFTSLYFLMYLFIFGWAMSSLLCRLFSSCVEWGDSWLQCWGFSLWWPLRSWSTGSRVCGLQQLWHMSSVLWCMGLVALRHFGSSRTRDQTHISCIGQAGSLPLSQ